MEFAIRLVLSCWPDFCKQYCLWLLIPFWIGLAVSLYRRKILYMLIGLAAAFVLSWIATTIAVFTTSV